MASNPFQRFIVQFAAHQGIFSEGDSGATMYIVQSGRVRLFRQMGKQQREVCCMEKGDFFSEMSILEGLPHQFSAEAVEDTELIEINHMIFDKMIKSNIEIAIRMLRKLSIRLRDAESRATQAEVDGGVTGFKLPSASGAMPQVTSEMPTSGLRLESAESGMVYALEPDGTLVGRYDPVTELRPDVDLTEVDLKRSVSRRHARIARSGDGHVIAEEVGALNGTFVNGTKLVTGQPVALSDGDQVGFGMVKMIFRCSA
jgi:CRP-like cAMP-binding protein